MAELTGWPTDGAEGSVSSEARWRKMAKLWAPSGTVTGLAPTLGSGVINVTAGSAWMDGHYAELTSPASETNSANGLLVVRFTPADNTFELVYRDGATTPTQTDAVWELPIAQMTAGALIDLRDFTTAGGVLGYIGQASGPGPATDYTGVVTICTLTATTEVGRVYEVMAYCQGQQVVNAGAPMVRMSGTGAPSGSPILFFLPAAINASVQGTAAGVHIPTSTASRTFTLTGQSSAAALRLNPDAARIWLKDIGAA